MCIVRVLAISGTSMGESRFSVSIIQTTFVSRTQRQLLGDQLQPMHRFYHEGQALQHSWEPPLVQIMESLIYPKMA
jgi:hypothetical protein